MTYISDEQSVRGGKPIELFEFIGTYANFRYTNDIADIIFNGNTYKAIAISRSEVNAGTQEDDGIDLTVELGVQNEIVKVYGFRPAPPRLQLTIYRYHNIAQFVPYWTGPIDNINVDDDLATLRSPSALGVALNSSCPSTYYQTPCNHVLFDRRCNVDRNAWSHDTTIAAVSGRTINVASLGVCAGKMIGGEIVLTSGERRTVTAESGLALTINFPFAEVEVGGEVELAVGCNHLYGKNDGGVGHCINRFNNGARFGGFPYIPTVNPFQDGID